LTSRRSAKGDIIVILDRDGSTLSALVTTDKLDVFLRHLLDGYFDNDTVEFVQANFLVPDAEIFGFDLELTTLVTPHSCTGRVGFCSKHSSCTR
jgi:hypothetical protein